MPFVYIAHLEGLLGDPSNPHATAGHYTGAAIDWRLREEEHRDGAGSKLLAAANARGIAWRIAQVYELPTLADAETLERLLKARSHTSTRCLHCQAVACGEQPPAEPIIVKVDDLTTFTGRKPIAEVVERRQLRLNKRRQQAREEAAWLSAVHADSDQMIQQPTGALPVGGPDGDTLGTIYGDESTRWPLELVGLEFDIDAWRRGKLDAAAHEIERVRRALRGK